MPTEEQTYRDGTRTQLSSILDQVKFTNGKVRWLEKMIYLAIGGLGVLAIIVLPLTWALISSGKL